MFVPGKIYYCGQMSPMKFAVDRCPCGQRAVWADVLWADVPDSKKETPGIFPCFSKHTKLSFHEAFLPPGFPLWVLGSGIGPISPPACRKR